MKPDFRPEQYLDMEVIQTEIHSHTESVNGSQCSKRQVTESAAGQIDFNHDSR